MNIKNSKVILYVLTLKQLKDFQRETFQILNIDFKDFELSLNQKKAIGIKIDKMNLCKSVMHPWYTYWLIVDNKSLKAIGTIGFKGLSVDDCVEVGYEIVDKFYGSGYSSTSLNLLIKWVQKQKVCKKITATRVLKDNYGSQRVLEKNGFLRTTNDDTNFNYEHNMIV